MNPWRTPTETWWSELDVAEIDVVAYELVDAMKTHEENCSECQANGYGCTVIRDLLELTVRWRDKRLLETKAETIRSEVDV
jgi:hypothetical protein